MRRRPRFTLVLVLMLSVVGCGDGGSPGPDDIEFDIPVGARVRVEDDALVPEEVTVEVGETVEFTIAGQEDHRLVGEDHLFDTGDLRPGETFAFLFEELGRFTYEDQSDGPDRTGTVVVEPAHD